MCLKYVVLSVVTTFKVSVSRIELMVNAFVKLMNITEHADCSPPTGNENVKKPYEPFAGPQGKNFSLYSI